jgi:ribosomal protein L32
MAVPKKRTSKSKKNARKANWKEKDIKLPKNLYL